MKKVYVYMHHQGFDFFLSDRELSKEERYCSHCDEHDELYAVYVDDISLKECMQHLFEEGYDIIFTETISYEYKVDNGKSITFIIKSSDLFQDEDAPNNYNFRVVLIW